MKLKLNLLLKINIQSQTGSNPMRQNREQDRLAWLLILPFSLDSIELEHSSRMSYVHKVADSFRLDFSFRRDLIDHYRLFLLQHHQFVHHHQVEHYYVSLLLNLQIRSEKKKIDDNCPTCPLNVNKVIRIDRQLSRCEIIFNCWIILNDISTFTKNVPIVNVFCWTDSI